MIVLQLATAPVFGRTDGAACNYDSEATDDDGSCEYAVDNFDCDGNCVVDVDCAGECGGSAVADDCGVCGGDGTSCLESTRTFIVVMPIFMDSSLIQVPV